MSANFFEFSRQRILIVNFAEFLLPEFLFEESRRIKTQTISSNTKTNVICSRRWRGNRHARPRGPGKHLQPRWAGCKSSHFKFTFLPSLVEMRLWNADSFISHFYFDQNDKTVKLYFLNRVYFLSVFSSFSNVTFFVKISKNKGNTGRCCQPTGRKKRKK